MRRLFISIGIAMIMLTSLFSTVVYKADIISAETKDSIKTNDSDKYGIKELCSRFGFDVDAPEYLPKGAEHTSTNYVNNSNPVVNLNFICKESDTPPYLEKDFQIIYTYIKEDTTPEKYILEFNDWKLEEPILVNGTEGYIVSTPNPQVDSQLFLIIYYKGNTLMEIFTSNISYAEAYQILKSIKWKGVSLWKN